MSGESFIKVSDFPVLPLELAVFGPSNSMLSDSEAVFTPLNADNMTVAQKNFLAAQCTGQIQDGGIDIRFGDAGNQMKRRYGLPKSTVDRWIKNLKQGKPNYDSRGRPEALDEQGKRDFLAEVAAGTDVVTGKGKRKTMTKACMIGPEITAAANKHARLTKERAGLIIDVTDEDIILHDDTIDKLKKVSIFGLYIFLDLS
jgi:hypothetical protein